MNENPLIFILNQEVGVSIPLGVEVTQATVTYRQRTGNGFSTTTVTYWQNEQEQQLMEFPQ